MKNKSKNLTYSTTFELDPKRLPKTIAKSEKKQKKISGAPGESRTPNLLIRSQTLYPIELQAQH